MIIILTTLSLILGIVAGYYIQPSPAVSYILAALSAIAFILAYWKSNKDFIQKPYFAACTFLLAFFTGILSFTLHYEPNQQKHYSHFLESDDTIIEGIISERLKPNDYNEKYYLKVQSVNQKPATGKILLMAGRGKTSSLHAGDKILIASIPQPIPKPLNPYQFDYASYMAKQNVFDQLTLRDNYIKAGQVNNLDYYLESFRRTLMGSFSIHGYTTETTNIINALLLGQRQDLNKEIATSYTDSGVVHILAISGLHIAILFYILNLILKPLKRLHKRGYLLQLILILSFLWMFALISGLSASVVRSVVMFSFISIGLYLNRNASIYNSIAVSALFLLLINPNYLFDAGFQLSYLAVIAIVAMQPFYKNIRISKYKAVNYFADVCIVSLVAQIGVLPLSLYYFNQFPLLFLLANIVVIPLSNIVLMLGILVLALNFISADIAIFIGKALKFLIQSMNSFTVWIASFDSLIIKDIPFTFVLTIVLYAALIAFILWLYNKSYRQTLVLLCFVLFFQITFTTTKWDSATRDELILFNNRKQTLIASKSKDGVIIYSNDSLALESRVIKTYSKESFNPELAHIPLPNVLWFNRQKILLIDSSGGYPKTIKPDILIVTQSPKINFDKTLLELKPVKVVADATNYKSYIKRWKASCKKHNIPFHATTEQGFYRLEK